ncbi:glycosyltransferase family 4 protein [Qipengyuania sp. ASV99]|uniref:glycosyltransferase family 4 protein n=1 Tax=Qipengyuania sp. ASV99 TaxID=3399681 RepID=UPI003A4C5C2A
MLMFGVAGALRERGWHVEIAVGSDAMIDRFTSADFPVHIVPGLNLGDRSPISMGKGAVAMRRIVRQNGISVLHSFNAQAGLLGWAATRGFGVKVVNTVLGAGKEALLRLMPFHLIAVSDFVKRDLIAHGVPEGRITTVHNGVLTSAHLLAGKEQFEALWQSRRKDKVFRIAGIAMMNGDKGQRASIQAFAALAALEPQKELELVLIGDGSRRAALEALAESSGVGDRVRFAGALNDVFPELDRAHVFLHLSPQETFGIVLAEAQARGLPAVSFAIGGIPEVVLDLEGGVLLPLGEIGKVAHALHDLSCDLDTCETMGWHGLERTRRLFMRDTLGARTEAVYAAL